MHVLVVGNVTRDVVADGVLPGGSVLYAARAYAALGHRVHVITCLSSAWSASELFGPGVTVDARRSDAMPTFENLYDPDGNRTQYVAEQGEAISASSPPGAFDWLHLAPVLGEIDLEHWSSITAGTRCVAGLQGWLRRVDESGRVRPSAWPAVAHAFSLACLSVEDIEGDVDLVANLRRAGVAVGLTRSSAGAEYHDDELHVSEPAFRVDVVDPTGAGDVFAAAFAHATWGDGLEPREALRFANAAASIAIEGVTTSQLHRVGEAYRRAGIPRREAVNP